MNITSNHNQPNFGMAFHIHDGVSDIIKKRVKYPGDIRKLSEIINKQKTNDIVDIRLHTNLDNKTISAVVYDTRYSSESFTKHYSENIFTRMFGGGIVGFLEKLGKIADEQAVIIKDEIKMQKAIDEVLK